MKRINVLLFFISPVLFFLGLSDCKAQETYQQRVQNYINTYKDISISEMKRAGVPASITLAQGIIETNAGNSLLATEANNHFGIKCHDDWNGKTYYFDDDAPNECFRHYDNAEQSFTDHSDFLKNKPRYACLFQLDITDYKAWAKGLKACGYATNPQYAEMLIKAIEDNQLQQYDLLGLDTNYVVNHPMTNDSASLCRVQGQDPDTDPIVSEKDIDPKNGRVYYVNNVKCIDLKSGESLAKIGYAYEMGLKKLLKYNDMTSKSKVKPGDRIFLQPKRRNGDIAYHTVVEGETMFSISQLHGIQLVYLYEKNKMQMGTQPEIGEILNLRSDRISPPKLRTEQKIQEKELTAFHPDSSSSIYIVKKGDTLYSISKNFNLTVDQLKQLNNLQGDSIHAGDKLKVN